MRKESLTKNNSNRILFQYYGREIGVKEVLKDDKCNDREDFLLGTEQR